MSPFKHVSLIALLGAAGLLLVAWLYQFITSPEQRLARLQWQVKAKGGQVFVASLAGKKQAFLLQDCKLDLLDASQRRVQRQRVLEPDFYPFAYCTEQSITQRGSILEVHLLMRALGSGGGNQGGGFYRSEDGRQWTRL